MDRIKKRYPLNPAQKDIIKHYEKLISGELAHNQILSILNQNGKIWPSGRLSKMSSSILIHLTRSKILSII